MDQTEVPQEIMSLLEILPQYFARQILEYENSHKIIEIVMDLGRELEVRYTDGMLIIPHIIQSYELESITQNLGAFGPDDRAGLDRSLHRISRIENRTGQTVGFTMRVGRDFPASIELVKEYVESGRSLLILGAPSTGKTTILRAVANHLSTSAGKRVVIVDTSNEIAGDGDVPHPAIGRARRLQVPLGKSQADIMIRAVENHNPEVIIVDEISSIEEALASVTIAERGVQLIATAHGRELENLIKNKPLQDLVGGISTVTVSDSTASRKGLVSKTVQERKTRPPFSIIVEVLSYNEVNIYEDVVSAVDTHLQGGKAVPERRLLENGRVHILQKPKLVIQTMDQPTVKERQPRGGLRPSRARNGKIR